MKVRAAVARAPGADFTLEELELDDPREDEILVRIQAAGLCHTDLVFRDMETEVSLPAVLGHEGAGIVEKVGSGVTKVKVGDHVLLTFRSCGSCRRCTHGDPACCHELTALNFVGRRPDGTTALRSGDSAVSSNFFGQSSFATHAIAYERNVVKVAPDLDLATYAPLGCGVQTGAGGIMRSLGCRPGSSVVIIGAGTVGLSAVLGAVVQGCAQIIVIEPMAARRQLAIELGASHAVDPTAGDAVEQIRSILPEGAEYAFDTSGVVSALEAVFAYLAPNGVLGLVGVPSDPGASLQVPIALAITFGFRIQGIIEGDSEPDTFIPELIRLHKDGRFPFDRLITTYPFNDINRAIADQHDGKCVKVVLVTGDADGGA